jgi:hypothetical protein
MSSEKSEKLFFETIAIIGAIAGCFTIMAYSLDFVTKRAWPYLAVSLLSSLLLVIGGLALSLKRRKKGGPMDAASIGFNREQVIAELERGLALFESEYNRKASSNFKLTPRPIA